jgi:hypothetical protein
MQTGDRDVLGCDAVWLAEWFLVFQKIIVHSSSRVEDEGNMILQSAGSFSLNDTASHRRRPELSATLCDNLKPHVNMNSVREGKYDLDFKNPNTDKSKWIDGQELTNLYLEFIKDFPVVSIEDPFDQDHWEAWTNMTANTSIQVTPTKQHGVAAGYWLSVSCNDCCSYTGLLCLLAGFREDNCPYRVECENAGGLHAHVVTLFHGARS